jgi:hypothetical protein
MAFLNYKEAIRMKTSIAILIVIAVFSLLSFKAFRVASRGQQEQIAELQNAPDKGTVAWHARVAKANGQRTVVISYSIEDYGGAEGLDEALSRLGAVVAQLIGHKAFIVSSNELYRDDDIRTWYKFKILENLSQKPLPRCFTCGVDRELEKRIPQEMLPLNADELLIETDGGSVEVDGVTVTMVNTKIPSFSESTHYVLLLSVDPSGKVGILNLGPVGIYTLSSQDQIEPISKENHPVVRDMMKMYGNSLESLRGYVQRHPSTQ